MPATPLDPSSAPSGAPYDSQAAALEPRVCLNCEAVLTGSFCAGCGQADIDPRKRLGTFAGELIDTLFSLDSKLLRSLGNLIFRPGRLTLDYMAGRRARSIPPLRMYLFVSMLFFLCFAFDPPSIDRVELTVGGVLVGSDLARHDEVPTGDKPLTISLPGPRTSWLPGSEEVRDSLPALRKMPPQELLNRLTHGLQSTVPKVLFLTLPLLALVLTLLYLRKGSYLEHLVFAVHLQTFLFLMPLPARLIESSSWATVYVLLVCFVWMPLYVWRALTRVYPAAWWKTLMKTLVVLVTYGMLIILCFYITMTILVMSIQ